MGRFLLGLSLISVAHYASLVYAWGLRVESLAAFIALEAARVVLVMWTAASPRRGGP